MTATSVPDAVRRSLGAACVWLLAFGRFPIAAIYELQPGALIDWGNVFYYGKLEDINSRACTLDRWSDTDGFGRTVSKAPAAYDRRVFLARSGGLRADGLQIQARVRF